MSALEPVLAKAFHRAPAVDANAEIAAQREANGFLGKDGLSYEVVLDAAETLQGAAEKLLPKLVYFLDCRGLRLSDARGVFMSVFVGDQLYFVHATDFVGALARSSGLSLDELRAKYGAASTG